MVLQGLVDRTMTTGEMRGAKTPSQTFNRDAPARALLHSLHSHAFHCYIGPSSTKTFCLQSNLLRGRLSMSIVISFVEIATVVVFGSFLE